MQRAPWLRRLAWSMVILSFPVWFFAFVAPFLPLSVSARGVVAAGAIGAGEALFWIGGAIVGAEGMARLRAPKMRTGRSMAGRRVVVVGATGGLGGAIVAAVEREGGSVLALTRTELDLARPETIEAAAGLGEVDHVVCAAGVDVRKALAEHSAEDIARTLAVDLAGPIHLVRAFGPRLRRGGSVVVLGGFADGGLALPFYSVDVAARAGLAAFAEAMNREGAALGLDQRVSWVCPAPADTAAERPYAALWADMGARLVAPEVVADVVLQAMLSRRAQTVMGASTRVLAWINRLSPGLADLVAVGRMSVRLREAFGPAASGRVGDNASAQ